MKKTTLLTFILLANFLVFSQDSLQDPKKFNVGISIVEDPGLFAWQINGISNSIHAEKWAGQRLIISKAARIF